MKKKIILLGITLYLIFIFTFNKEIKLILEEMTDIYFSTYIACLFPFIFLINLFLSTNYLIDICKKLKKAPFLFDIFIILLIILIGIPGNVSLIKYLEDSKIISKQKKDNLVNNFLGISFPFYYFVILQNHPLKNLIIFILLGSNLVLYLLSNYKESPKQINALEIKINPIIKTGISLYSILFSLLLFSTFTIIPKMFFKGETLFFINSLIEFSYNLISLSKIETLPGILLLLFSLSFTSCSLILQIKLSDNSVNIMQYIKRRFIIALINTITIFLFL